MKKIYAVAPEEVAKGPGTRNKWRGSTRTDRRKPKIRRDVAVMAEVFSLLARSPGLPAPTGAPRVSFRMDYSVAPGTTGRSRNDALPQLRSGQHGSPVSAQRRVVIREAASIRAELGEGGCASEANSSKVLSSTASRKYRSRNCRSANFIGRGG